MFWKSDDVLQKIQWFSISRKLAATEARTLSLGHAYQKA
jgi:hypothetical protein